MKLMVDLSVIPMGVGVSVSGYVAACEPMIHEAALGHRLHAFGANIEGKWHDVFVTINRCHEVVHGMGAPRIHTSITAGTRTNRGLSLDEKVRSVEAKLGWSILPFHSTDGGTR